MPEESKPIEYKGELVEVIGKICGCTIIRTTASDGKKRTEGTCISKEARDKLAAILEEEMILRVNPKVVLDDNPPAAPVT